jgi:hypothetical protein
MKPLFAMLLLLAATLSAQQPPSALDDITFTWKNGKQTGFKKTTPEIDRFDTLQIDVPQSFLIDAGKQLGANAPPSPLLDELKAFTAVAQALDTYTTAIANAAARSPGTDISLDANVVAARETLATALQTFINVVRAADPALYNRISDALLGGGYPGLALALKTGIDELTLRLATQARERGAFAMTASIVPLEADARPVHLPGYDTIAQADVAAVPSLIPVVDDRTRAEAMAAQTLADVTKQLGQFKPEFQKSMQELQSALVNLRTTLQTDVLEKNLAELETELQNATTADLPLLVQAQNARRLVQTINSAQLTLAGTSNMDRLLGLANSVSTTANGLVSASQTLPSDLQKLATDTEALEKKRAGIVKAATLAAIKGAATNFLTQQTYFKALAGNIKSLSSQFAANNEAALSAARLEETAISIAQTPNLSTSLDLSRIAGDVHVRDRIVVQAALYRVNADNSRTVVASGQQSFAVQEYGFFADNVRAGLLFVQPRSRIERTISYQPTPALGYYWRYGSTKHPRWNTLSPSFGFTMTLLDFNDADDLELGFAGGISLVRDLVWTGYGRNLQAKANYFYVGMNPLLFVELIRR